MELKKTITIPKGIAIAVSMVIGSGLFGLPGIVIATGGPQTALLGWIAISLLMIPMIILFAQLGVKYTTSAGLAKYAEVALGPWAKSGVTLVLCGTFTIGIPALTAIGSAYACQLLGLIEADYMYPIAILFLIISTIMNLLGVKFTAYVNSISMYLLFGLITAFVGLNLDYFAAGVGLLRESSTYTFNFPTLWATSALLFWAYLGWENMSFSVEEFRNPTKSIPRVYYYSFAIVVLIYMALALTASGAQVKGVNMEGIGSLTELLRQSALFYPLMLVMIIVKIANANAWVFGASRLIYSAGKDNILPTYLGILDKNGIPRNSLITLGCFYTIFIMVMYVFSISISTIVLLVSQNFLILFATSIIAYWKSFPKTPFHMSITAIASLSSVFLLTGFSYWIIYPLALLIIGYQRHQYNAKIKGFA